MEGDSLQEVVMERDGKFEVLSAVDLQAEHDQQLQQPQVDATADVPVGATVTNQAYVETKTTLLQKEETGDKGLVLPTAEPCSLQELEIRTKNLQLNDSEPSVGNKLGEHALKDVTYTEQSQPTHSETNDTVTVRACGPPARTKVEVELSDVRSECCKPPLPTEGSSVDRGSIDVSLVPPHPALEKSLPHNKEEVKLQQQIRTQSAPGSRSTRSSRRWKEEEEAEEEERRKRVSEAAFNAWITRKNEEVMERRKQERAKLSSKVEDEQKKKEMCDLVYKNWLEAKNKQYQTQRARETLSRPSTSVPRRDEEYCRQAFENWMKKKRTQYLEEMKKQCMRSQEMEEAAERADPSVIDKAYKEWLQRKRAQAKEEAVKKDHYKRLYFSQPRKLKEHTKQR
jgi:hypothetical protein